VPACKATASLLAVAPPWWPRLCAHVAPCHSWPNRSHRDVTPSAHKSLHALHAACHAGRCSCRYGGGFGGANNITVLGCCLISPDLMKGCCMQLRDAQPARPALAAVAAEATLAVCENVKTCCRSHCPGSPHTKMRRSSCRRHVPSWQCASYYTQMQIARACNAPPLAVPHACTSIPALPQAAPLTLGPPEHMHASGCRVRRLPTAMHGML
jgi:hypothetical protein